MEHEAKTFRASASFTCLVAVVLACGGCGLLSKGQVDFDVSAKDRGVASWYGVDFHGRLAADGRPYNMYGLTAAHRSLPLGSVVRVLNIANGRSVVVRITDRGPYAPGRIIDVSYAAASRLDMLTQGLAPVLIDVVGEGRLLTQWDWNGLGRFDLSERQAARHNRYHGAADSSEGTNGEAQLYDVWGLPRYRRVADVLAANHYVDRRVAMLLMA